MIKIEFPEPNTSVWKRWRDECRKETKALITLVDSGNKPEIKNLYKRRSIKNSVYCSSNGPFHGKCAYCECYINDFQHGDIEHYRPKKGVTDEKDRPIFRLNENGELQRDENGKPIPHPGYYWLAYDWSNLLPSCIACNQASKNKAKRTNSAKPMKFGKHNRFPVKGKHAQTPDEVEREQPLLLNPTVDDPSEHLRIDTRTGQMLACSERGRMSIQVFALNDRERLPQNRLLVMRAVSALFDEICSSSASEEKRQEAIQELRAMSDGSREYTLAAKAKLEELVLHV